MNERLDLLITWAPFLLGGFGMNILIALAATLIGTLLGSLLALMRFSKRRPVAAFANGTSSFFRTVPTLVLLFYLATLIPNEIEISQTYVLKIPIWVKAALAMSASPLGFTSWNLYTSLILWQDGKRGAALIFVPNWLSGFSMTLLASSTSSLVGVSELVSRSNAVIAATGSTHTILIYTFAPFVFVTACLSFGWLINRIKARLLIRYS
jgi:polar amino acid transport system permease protein